MLRQVNLRLPDEQYERLEAVRGDRPRNMWIREAIEQRLRRDAPADHGRSGMFLRRIRRSGR